MAFKITLILVQAVKYYFLTNVAHTQIPTHVHVQTLNKDVSQHTQTRLALLFGLS